MKKIVLLGFAFIAFACSSNDDEREEECEYKIWNLANAGGIYFATYGPTEAEAGTVEVNEATFEYYSGLGNTTNGSICWEGTRE